MMKQYKPDITILLETKCSRQVARNVIKQLGCTNYIIEEAQGFAGDFNEIKDSSEKRGGAPTDLRACNAFNNWINNCGLIDLGFIGSRFTWRGPQWEGQERIFKRLDRAMANSSWRNRFHEATVEVLTRMKSDHHPLLITTEKRLNGIRDRPFRFEAMWTMHPDFQNLIETSWNNHHHLNNALDKLKKDLIEWNKSYFGNIFKTKRRIQNRLAGIQRSSTYGKNPYLDGLEQKLIKELNEVLDKEETFWLQKSREKWIMDGDRNTYHTKAIVKRGKNGILKLRGHEGEWIEEEEDLKKHITCHFKNLYQEEVRVVPFELDHYDLPNFSLSDCRKLAATPTEMEIRRALFNIGSLKAPGSDGFPALIYKNNWDIMKNKVCDFIQSCWKNPEIIKQANTTLITLVPKLNHPESINQFRPIALCNVTYKVLTKIIVDRIKPHLSDRIAAYDKLSWDFIKVRLKELKLPVKVIQIIMHCVNSVSYNVLWNGNKTEEFIPKRGVRQGDPISPYLFVICMDKLSQLIEELVHLGEWKPMAAGRRGPRISHLIFADDVLLFTEASQEQMQRVKEVLEKFCKASGLKINEEKSSIVFSKSTYINLRRRIMDIAKFREQKELGKYLGALITNNRGGKKKFKDVMGRVQSKLKGWKSKCLSLAGRLTLAQASISPALNFQMQHDRVPKGVCQEIEKLQRSFIWGDEPNHRKIHLISWKTLCRPKHEGGMGFRKITSMNDAFLMKILWQMEGEPGKLWVEVLKHKYYPGGQLKNNIRSKSSDSMLWKELVKIWPIYQKNSIQYIGNGCATNFWKDQWVLEEGALKNHTLNPNMNSNSLVKDWTNEKGEWDREQLRLNLPEVIVQKITAMCPPNQDQEGDKRGWKHTEDGNFSIAATYKALNNWSKPQKTIWKQIWEWKGTQKIKVFMWTAIHRRILTNERKSKIFGGSGDCYACHGTQESCIHVLRDCQRVSTIWVQLLDSSKIQSFFNLNWVEWVKLNLTQQLGKSKNFDWKDIFMVACWRMWYWRNKEINDDNYRRPYQPHIDIMNQVQEIKQTLKRNYLIKGLKMKREVHVSWVPPPEGWVKLNTDGSSQGNMRRAGCGGLVRNENGRWVAGFTCRIGNCTAFTAELWGVMEGLKLAWTMGMKRIIVECDSTAVVKLLNGERNLEKHPNSLVRRIDALKKKDWRIFFVQIYREANRSADYLDRKSLETGDDFLFWDTPSPELARIIYEDCTGASLPRSICI
ncbi:uncharacterized protein LOC130962625 [Arachis stenosperma]|uniref:uncharacterized protein LOC130962625 n=1 Tax=Arachis stenosperma TaxID=217475 RepID=UPI0025AC74A5|nr:uncharacterized protein LOC130962625 [Arachis stenosperma]